MLFSACAYPLLRPALFALDPETAHNLTLSALDAAYAMGLLKPGAMGRPLRLMGLPLANPVGLAAGLDKNGEHIDALAALGFGFIEIGTVTPKAQAGNPRPRLFRLPASQAIINRMGFNNQGLDTFLANVRNSTLRARGGILGLNIGKNATTPLEDAASDYLACLDAVYPHADYVTVNISSPNTKNLRSLQGGDELSALLDTLGERRDQLAAQHGRRVPLAVKIAPDLDSEQVDTIADLLPRHGIDGVIATNTTLSRAAVEGQPHADETGGLSGTPVREMALRVVERLRRQAGPELAIIGVGGIMRGGHARDLIQAGADAVQIYTGLIYRGPALVEECIKAI